jgi:hypothetical protein
MTPCRGSEDFVRLGGRFKLKYRSGDGSYVESFVSGLAAIERAAAVQSLGATGLLIENADGEQILNAREIALAVKGLDDAPEH